VLPSPELWEGWTLSETLAGARRSGRATESFVQLTELVERAAYARTPPNEAEVKTIETAATVVVTTPRRIDGHS
jgi:hypothetical protein